MYSIQSYLWIRIGDDTESVIDNGRKTKTIEKLDWILSCSYRICV